MTDTSATDALSAAHGALTSDLAVATASRDAAQAELDGLRGQADTATLRLIDQPLSSRDRSLSAAADALIARIRNLAAQVDRLDDRIATLESERALTGQRLALFNGEKIKDAQALVEGASRDVPFVLFPIRIETRFADGDQVGQLNLLVRMFPDDIHIQTDPRDVEADELTIREAYAATLANGDRERAERDLLSTTTPQRAAWLARSLGPDVPSVPEPVSGALGWASLLPTRWVVIVRSDGADLASAISAPVADEARTLIFEPTTPGDPVVPSWMRDFDAAVEAGMAVTVPLNRATTAKAREDGVDVIVGGVNHSTGPEAGSSLIGQALTGHLYGAGLCLVPQGRATNNTELGRTDNNGSAQQTFRDLLSPPRLPAQADVDAARLARALGLEREALAPIARDASGKMLTGEIDAQAMATLLWPVAQGYAGREITKVEAPYGHFTRFVRGRGPLPVLRVGDLPYGVVIAGPLERVPSNDPGRTVVEQSPFADPEPWRRALARTPSVPTGVSSPEEFIEMLRLTGTSASYRMRPVHESTARVDSSHGALTTGARLLLGKYSWLPLLRTTTLTFHWRRGLVTAEGDDPVTASRYLSALADSLAGVASNNDGAPPATLPPPVVSSPALLYHLARHGALFTARWADLIAAELPERSPFLTAVTTAYDVQPGQITAKDTVSLYTSLGKSTGLPADFFNPVAGPGASIQADSVVVDRERETAPGDREPSTSLASLLPAIARTARAGRGGPVPRRGRPGTPIDPGGTRPDESGGLIEPGGPGHPGGPGPSQPLPPAVIDQLLDAPLALGPIGPPATLPPPVDTVDIGANARVSEFVAAARHLAKLDEDQLELLMAETLDTAAYRRDAWVASVHARHLSLLRERRPTGAHLGCYGFVLGLRVERNPVAADGRSEHVGDPATTGGFLAAHTLDQAATLAVIRNAHLTHAHDDETADVLRLNLDSRRVRLGKELIDAVHNGHPPADVLGARFERILHRRNQVLVDQASPTAGINRYLADFRTAFPQRPRDSSSDEARDRVVNGVTLLRAWQGLRDSQTSGAPLSDLLGAAASAGHRSELEGVLSQLESQVDAANDLLLFEATYHAVRGDRSAATSALDSHGGTSTPPEITAVATPAAGPSFTHRVVALNPEQPIATWPDRTGLRASLAPELNHWLEGVLGDAERIRWGIRVGGSLSVHSLADTHLDAIDLVWTAERWGRRAAVANQSDVDDMSCHLLAAASATVHSSADLVLDGDQLRTALGDGEVTLGDIGELCVRLGRAIRASRPLTPGDLSPAGDEQEADHDSTVMAKRIRSAIAVAESAASGLQPIIDDLGSLQVGSELSQEQRHRALKRVSQANRAGAGIDPIDPFLIEDSHGIVDYLDSLRAGTTKLRDAARTAAASLDAASTSDDASSEFRQAATVLVGRDFPLQVPFTLPVDSQEALTDAAVALSADVTQSERRSWLQQAARVVPAVSDAELALILGDAVGAGAHTIGLAQLPWVAGEPWVGSALQTDMPELTASTSIVAIGPGASFSGNRFTGLAIGTIIDRVPTVDHTAGIAFPFDQPSARAPQAIVIAVAPDAEQLAADQTSDRPWRWEELAETIESVIEETKLRAADPNYLEGLGLTLPTTLVPRNPKSTVFNVDLVSEALINMREG
jgi:hypothetical protein